MVERTTQLSVFLHPAENTASGAGGSRLRLVGSDPGTHAQPALADRSTPATTLGPRLPYCLCHRGVPHCRRATRAQHLHGRHADAFLQSRTPICGRGSPDCSRDSADRAHMSSFGSAAGKQLFKSSSKERLNTTPKYPASSPARCLTSPRRFVPVGVKGRRRSYSDRRASFQVIASRPPATISLNVGQSENRQPVHRSK